MYEWSVEDANEKVAIPENASVLFHAAAHISLRYDDPAEAPADLRVDAQGTFDLLTAAEMAGIPQITHFSTGKMYAPAPRMARDDTALYPSSRAPFYPASKLASEIYADFLRRTEVLRIATLRIASAYCPGMTAGGLMPSFVRKVLAGERLTVDDGGRYGVDLVHVDDIVEGVTSAAARSASGIFNIGSGERPTTLRVAGVILRIVGASPDALVLRPASSQNSPQGHPGWTSRKQDQNSDSPQLPSNRDFDRTLSGVARTVKE
jgi:UDP-glucose 4-epimerase